MGKVYFVGAGPGDPELIAWKGRVVLEAAGCVIYDECVAPALLDVAPETAVRLRAGEADLVECARGEGTVVRLIPGDPFLFGRGGEEAGLLARAGLSFEVVPGLTVEGSVASYCGLPLNEPVVFVPPDAGTRAAVTIANASPSELAAAGVSAGTPAVAVYGPTLASQRTVAAALGSLPPDEKATIVLGVEAPAELNWFERRPLYGIRVAVTRARGQAGELSGRLRALGAEVDEIPTIEIVPAGDYGPLDAAIGELAAYDWLIFTSANGVRFFVERLDRSPADLRLLRARICAIGPATRRAVEALHLKVDLMPREYVAEGLLEAFAEHDLRGKRMLLARAAVARDVLPEELRRRGARVDVVEAYRTVIPREARERAAALFSSGSKPHWITFTSSSTVMNFAEIAGVGSLEGVRVASIGPVTTETARRLGIGVDVQARAYTADGLAEAITEACSPVTGLPSAP